MTVGTNRLEWCLLLSGLVLIAPLASRAEEPPKPVIRDKQAEVDRARLEVLRALEQFREAEAHLKQAEKKLRELEGKATPSSADNRIQTKIFPVSKPKANELAKLVIELFGKEGILVAVDDRANLLIVRGKAEDLQEITALVTQLVSQEIKEPRPESDVFVLRLKNATAPEMAALLTQVFGGGRTARAQIVAEPLTNSLLVRASDETRMEIQRVAIILDEGAAKPQKKPE